MDETLEIERTFDRLWPLLRSITGDGVRQTHDIIGEIVPLSRMEIPSGTSCFDWAVPQEWRVNEAYIVTPQGQRICDVAENNLHLLNYSAPFRGRMSLAELDKHLHSRPDMPEAIPYLTSYYTKRWGFCLSQAQRDTLTDGSYDVVVDTELFAGSLTISDAILHGASKREVLLSTYTCHPSLANNELSGPLVAAFLYRRLAAWPERRLTYRFVFLPETIGSIAYLHRCGDHLREAVVAGYVINCAGDPAPFTYKRSRQGNSLADRAAEHVLRRREGSRFLDFFPRGSDERQYCSPGFNLPVGSIMRSMYGTFPQYHTSFDNRDFISFDAMRESIDAYEDVLKAIELNRYYRNRVGFGEPQLGKYGLYPSLDNARDARRAKEAKEYSDAMMWLLSLADGSSDLLAISERCGIKIELLSEIASRCMEAGIMDASDEPFPYSGGARV